MKIITDYLKKQDKLVLISAWITSGLMLLFGILAQFLSFSPFIETLDHAIQKMEIRELIKLQFKPQPKMAPLKMMPIEAKKIITTSSVTPKENAEQPPDKPSLNVASLVQGFDMSRLISRETNAAKRGSSNLSNPAVAGISTEVNRQGRTLDNFDLTGVIENRNASFPAGRRSSMGGANGPTVGIGGTSHVGNGTGDGGTGLALSGRGTGRATRGVSNGDGRGSATISLPSGSGGSSASLDIHALIKWMKAHPGAIPKLVAYDMGHQSDDLSSAISFSSNGNRYTLFLSCNEFELLLRICLVEGNDFTLLKDNGIREESNFLTSGDVVRNAEKIQSLISSRKAPGERAATFYQIFWSWWLQQPESRS